MATVFPASSLLVRRIRELWTGSSVLHDAAVLFLEGRVAWVGPTSSAPDAAETHDAEGAVGMPGLVDPHTHTTFAGSRAADFERRLGELVTLATAGAD